MVERAVPLPVRRGRYVYPGGEGNTGSLSLPYGEGGTTARVVRLVLLPVTGGWYRWPGREGGTPAQDGEGGPLTVRRGRYR